MLRIVSKILFQLLPIILVITAIVKFTLPYHWGNDDMYTKVEDFRMRNDNINTLFFGNSIMNRHLIPEIFDANNDQNTYSYNMGLDNARYVEVQYLIKNFIQREDTKNIKNVFLMLNLPKPISNLQNNVRSKYYLDWGSTKLSIKYFKFYETWKKEASLAIKYAVENFLGIEQLKTMLNYKNGNKYLKDQTHKNRGYYSITDEMIDRESKVLQKRVDNFNRKKDEIEEQLAVHIKKLANPKRYKILQENDIALKESLLELKDICDKKEIELYIVHIPNLPYYYKLPEFNNIYLGDGIDYPEYFQFENRFDMSHLNKKGAEIHSKRMAQLYEGTVKNDGSLYLLQKDANTGSTTSSTVKIGAPINADKTQANRPKDYWGQLSKEIDLDQEQRQQIEVINAKYKALREELWKNENTHRKEYRELNTKMNKEISDLIGRRKVRLKAEFDKKWMKENKK